MAASLSPRAISVSSMSKAYGLPGLRIGWAVCRDPELAESENMGASGPVHMMLKRSISAVAWRSISP